MKTRIVAFAFAVLLLFAMRGDCAVTNIYSTQFEAAQGYNTNLDLIGQSGWLGSGSGGNGILPTGFNGQGQSAYIGFDAPHPTNSNLVVWKPVNFNPIAAGFPNVKFSVQMQIVDSTNGKRDDFRWSVYNIQGNRLFSLSFDNKYLDASYLLDGTNVLFTTDVLFTNSISYTLTVTMNFASNRWSASLGNALIATNKFITTTNAPLNLGDIDAVMNLLVAMSALPSDALQRFEVKFIVTVNT